MRSSILFLMGVMAFVSSFAGEWVSLPTTPWLLPLLNHNPEVKLTLPPSYDAAKFECTIVVYKPEASEGKIKRSQNRIECRAKRNPTEIIVASLASVAIERWGGRYGSFVQVENETFSRVLFETLKKTYSSPERIIPMSRTTLCDFNNFDCSESYSLAGGTLENPDGAYLFCEQNDDTARGVYQTRCVLKEI